MKKSLLFVLILSIQFIWAKDDVSIKKLKSKADDYLNTEVTIEGQVVKTDSASDKTFKAKKVLMYDKSNDTIEVTFEEKVEWDYSSEYEIEGRLKKKENGNLKIEADEYECLDCEEEEEETSSTLFLLIGIGVVIIAVLIVIVLKRGKKEIKADPLEKYTRSNQSNSTDQASSSSASEDEFRTIAFNVNDLPEKKDKPASPAKTMVMQKPPQAGNQVLPGSFSIVAGSTQENGIKLFGKSSTLGFIATIGREPGEPGGSSDQRTHLQVNNNTVSRRQAELIFRNNALIIKNLSSTNPSRLGTKEMKVGEELELSDGATITMGTVLIRYSK
jgi:hypothetical protein